MPSKQTASTSPTLRHPRYRDASPREQARRDRVVAVWLWGVAFLVFFMVIVGGATRLTDSGLAIVEWRPITGAIPPLSHAEWLIEFEKYRQIPEYQIVNRGMSLAAFQFIYWWEWGHRFLGRVVGVAFFVPLVFFLARGYVRPGFGWKLWGLFALGGLQGAIGWWMVASGLVDRVDVAPYRLATHLTLACIILTALVFVARSLAPARPGPQVPRLSLGAGLVVVAVLAQIFMGGLVAGLDAGLTYNTWPLIDGYVVPPAADLLMMSPVWVNFFENHLTVQFMHRLGAYALALLVLWHTVDVLLTDRRGLAGLTAKLLLALTFVQIAIGIATLLLVAPFAWSLAHQATGAVLLVVAAVHYRAVLPAVAVLKEERGPGAPGPRSFLIPSSGT